MLIATCILFPINRTLQYVEKALDLWALPFPIHHFSENDTSSSREPGTQVVTTFVSNQVDNAHVVKFNTLAPNDRLILV